MRYILLSVVWTVFLTVPLEARADCTLDTDCKGDRVCLADGRCGSPELKACRIDNECPGSYICSERNFCIDPGPGKKIVDLPPILPDKPASVRIAAPVLDDIRTPGFSAGARFALGQQLGNSSDVQDVAGPGDSGSSAVAIDWAVVPLWVDLGYRVTARDYLGLSVSLGFPSFTCEGGTAELPDTSLAVLALSDCSGSVVRLGGNWTHHFPVRGMKWIAPWVGLGAGYEITEAQYTSDFSTIVMNSRLTYQIDTLIRRQGFEFGNIQAGIDFPIVSKISAGPFLTFTAGRYSDYQLETVSDSTEVPSMDTSGELDEKPMHYWGFLGMRTTFN